MGGIVHVVGAGLSGLACATAVAKAGRRVVLHEATDHAGGRCRSWHDGHLDRIIDNGNHLILGANRECMAYLDRIGGRDGLLTWDPVDIPFMELPPSLRHPGESRDPGATGSSLYAASGNAVDGSDMPPLGSGFRRNDGRDETPHTLWTLRPGSGPLPLWLADPSRRVPDTSLTDYLAVLNLAFAGRTRTVADLLPVDHPLTKRLWKPFAVSILNTPYTEGSARLLWSVFRRTLLRGAEACRPWIAGPGGLSAALVDPALAFLLRHGADIRFGQRLKTLHRAQDGLAVALDFGTDGIGLRVDDHVVLALPPEATARLLPDLPVPNRFHAIMNAHFRLDRPVCLPGGHHLLGLVGGMAEWLFLRGDVVSVTVSAADAIIDRPTDDLLALLWRDVAGALGLDPASPDSGRIVKEKRATFAATPDQERLRPGPRLARNLFLAGDWTDTGLPATIEGAVQSGHRAAELVTARPS
ncbi:hydroxysqualene dehydroxylase [Niveispirillum sp. KHB5.9]|uniref:hydroxysqualene dehydroxylase n=1 Tax=Niveispirillum sp. KHB5.9 TaxID=3400269 RepID=UPI003A88ADEE